MSDRARGRQLLLAMAAVLMGGGCSSDEPAEGGSSPRLPDDYPMMVSASDLPNEYPIEVYLAFDADRPDDVALFQTGTSPSGLDLGAHLSPIRATTMITGEAIDVSEETPWGPFPQGDAIVPASHDDAFFREPERMTMQLNTQAHTVVITADLGPAVKRTVDETGEYERVPGLPSSGDITFRGELTVTCTAVGEEGRRVSDPDFESEFCAGVRDRFGLDPLLAALE